MASNVTHPVARIIARPHRVLAGHPRLFAAAAIGLLSAFALPGVLARQTRVLMAWDIGCLAFLLLSAAMFTLERHSTMAEDAARQEEGEWSVFAITVGAVGASLVAIIGEFTASKSAPPAARGFQVALIAATLLVSWLTTHTIFALRYAHEYYGTTGESTEPDGGLTFPETPEPDYWDFVYFAFVLGMTFQVSDVEITSRKLRRLATLHGLLSFLFSTVIVSMTVNIGASLLQ